MRTALVASQIAYLAHQDIRVYVEIIQVIAARNTCWVRPIAWVMTGVAIPIPEVYDLRNAPDLICPTSLIHCALDTEWLPVLDILYRGTARVCDRTEANQRLNRLLQVLFPSPTASHQGDNHSDDNGEAVVPNATRPWEKTLPPGAIPRADNLTLSDSPDQKSP